MCFGQKADSQGQSPGEDFCYTDSGKTADAQQFLFSEIREKIQLGRTEGFAGLPSRLRGACGFSVVAGAGSGAGSVGSEEVDMLGLCRCSNERGPPTPQWSGETWSH